MAPGREELQRRMREMEEPPKVLHVLHVENEDYELDRIREWFRNRKKRIEQWGRQHGHANLVVKLHGVRTIADALEHLKNQPAHIVLSDYHIPDAEEGDANAERHRETLEEFKALGREMAVAFLAHAQHGNAYPVLVTQVHPNAEQREGIARANLNFVTKDDLRTMGREEDPLDAHIQNAIRRLGMASEEEDRIDPSAFNEVMDGFRHVNPAKARALGNAKDPASEMVRRGLMRPVTDREKKDALGKMKRDETMDKKDLAALAQYEEALQKPPPKSKGKKK
ncbi:hypothetical protein HY572_04915 [Candidatus Micrarchaeota archaeon]|nr:hypothetical protein [Candidatus Micrarchaeota archaeon]